MLLAADTAVSGALPEPTAWHKVGTQGTFAKRKKTRARKKGLGSSHLISKSVVLVEFPLHSRSHGFNFSQFFMMKNFKFLWRLSPPYAQSVFVPDSYYPTVETDLPQIGGLAVSSVCSHDCLSLI